MFKRGENLQDLDFSGPQSTNVFNQTEKTVERLELRNAWAHCVNALYPDLHPLLRPERCTSFAFDKFRRELVLELDAKDGLWVLKGRRCLAEAPNTSPPDPTPPPPADGSAPSGGPKSSSPPSAAAPNERSGGEADGDSSPLNAEAPKAPRKRPPKSSLKRILCKTRRLARCVSESPRFRHTMSLIDDRVERMRDDADTLFALASASVRFARACATTAHAAIRDAIATRAEIDDAPYIARLERRVIEVAPGFSLVLHTFVQEPNWESWLFGKPLEEEQLVA